MDNALSVMVNLTDGGRLVDEADTQASPSRSLVEHLPGGMNTRTRLSDFEAASVPVVVIGLIDPYRFSRECLSNALANLEPDGAILPFDTVENCVAGCSTGLDLIIFYLHGAGVSDAAAMQKIATVAGLLPNVPLVVLTDAEDAHQLKSVYSTLKSGAQGIIATRTTGISIATAAIRLVRAGGTFAPTDMLMSDHLECPFENRAQPQHVEISASPEASLEVALSHSPNGAEHSPLPGIARQSRLTSRQMSVLSHVQRGHANKTIAHQLSMSQSTVKVHVRNIMRKLGATNRTQAVYKAQMMFDGTVAAKPIDA